MKKLIFTTISTFALVSAFAQFPIDNSKMPINQAHNEPVKAPIKQVSGKTTISEWYYQSELYKAFSIGGALQASVGLMMHDSLAKVAYSDGTFGKNSWLSTGCVLDPTDTMFYYSSTMAGLKLSKYNGYTLDSVGFSYLYVRNVDTVPNGIGGYRKTVDTLYIAYFKGAQIKQYYWSLAQGRMNAGMIGWTPGDVRMPANYFAMDTILLTNNDSTSVYNVTGGFENSFGIKTIRRKAPAGMVVTAPGPSGTTNSLVAYSVTFKSEIPTVVSSTPPQSIDTAYTSIKVNPNTMPAGTRRTNYFGFYEWINNGGTPWKNPSFWNTTLMGSWQAAYVPLNATLNGYIPGFLYTHEFFVDADFHLTSTANAEINEIKNDNFAMSSVYPNPASANEGVFVGFNLKSTSNVTIEIFNLMGQLVKTVTNKTFEAGQDGIDIKLSGLNTGVYFVKMTVNGETQTKKLTIVE